MHCGGWRVHRTLSDEIIARYEARDCHRAPGIAGETRGCCAARRRVSLKRFENRTVLWKPLVIVAPLGAIVLAVLYITYRLIDPIPPHRFAIAAGTAGSGYDKFARQYARILARDGVELEVRNAAGAVGDLSLLRDSASGVQATLTALGFTQPRDAATLYSLGGVFDAADIHFLQKRRPHYPFAQFRGKRLSIGTPGTALRSDLCRRYSPPPTHWTLLPSSLISTTPLQAIDALIAGEIDVAIVPQLERQPLAACARCPRGPIDERGAS